MKKILSSIVFVSLMILTIPFVSAEECCPTPDLNIPSVTEGDKEEAYVRKTDVEGDKEEAYVRKTDVEGDKEERTKTTFKTGKSLKDAVNAKEGDKEDRKEKRAKRRIERSQKILAHKTNFATRIEERVEGGLKSIPQERIINALMMIENKIIKIEDSKLDQDSKDTILDAYQALAEMLEELIVE